MKLKGVAWGPSCLLINLLGRCVSILTILSWLYMHTPGSCGHTQQKGYSLRVIKVVLLAHFVPCAEPNIHCLLWSGYRTKNWWLVGQTWTVTTDKLWLQCLWVVWTTVSMILWHVHFHRDRNSYIATNGSSVMRRHQLQKWKETFNHRLRVATSMLQNTCNLHAGSVTKGKAKLGMKWLCV